MVHFIDADLTADWEADSDDRWTVPFGGGVGHLVKFGKQPVDLKLQGFYNVEKPKYANDSIHKPPRFSGMRI